MTKEKLGRPQGTIEGILTRLVEDSNGCQVWTGKRRPDGYGVAHLQGREVRIHRAVYQHFRGPVEPGLVLHHRCRNRACANPEHLEPCTIHENVLKDCPDFYGRSERLKTHCPAGHPYSGVNVLYTKRQRICRACRSLRKREKRLQEQNGPINTTTGN